MANNFFVTGTDTEVGKTLVTEALMFKASGAGYKTIGLKPVAAGAEPDAVDGFPKNEDALALQAAATEKLDYAQVNPVCLQEAIAPHIAAQRENKTIRASQISGFLRGALLQAADVRFVEGAGGWLLPLNHRESLNQVVAELNLDVILVVGLRLGCLNHALLTARAIRQDGLRLVGWVGSQLDPDMPCVSENIETLQAMLPAPCLGVLSYDAGITPEKAAISLRLPFDG